MSLPTPSSPSHLDITPPPVIASTCIPSSGNNNNTSDMQDMSDTTLSTCSSHLVHSISPPDLTNPTFSHDSASQSHRHLSSSPPPFLNSSKSEETQIIIHSTMGSDQSVKAMIPSDAACSTPPSQICSPSLISSSSNGNVYSCYLDNQKAAIVPMVPNDFSEARERQEDGEGLLLGTSSSPFVSSSLPLSLPSVLTSEAVLSKAITPSVPCGDDIRLSSHEMSVSQCVLGVYAPISLISEKSKGTNFEISIDLCEEKQKERPHATVAKGRLALQSARGKLHLDPVSAAVICFRASTHTFVAEDVENMVDVNMNPSGVVTAPPIVGACFCAEVDVSLLPAAAKKVQHDAAALSAYASEHYEHVDVCYVRGGVAHVNFVSESALLSAVAAHVELSRCGHRGSVGRA